MVVGVDFGSSVTDAVAIMAGEPVAHTALSLPGPASTAVLDLALDGLTKQLAPQRPIPGPVAVTGGRSRDLPPVHRGLRLVRVSEPEAAARGALSLAGVSDALVVSCGTGTAMIVANSASESFEHVTGTPVGGGTLQALGRLLLAGRGANEVAELARSGDASKVDTTLADVLGGSLGELPATATAVSLGRLGSETGPLRSLPDPADLAASLCAMVAQTISFIALGAAKSAGSPNVVFVGRVSRFPAIAAMIKAVFAVYRYPHEPIFPAGAQLATALGAALAAAAWPGDSRAGHHDGHHDGHDPDLASS